MPRSLLIQMRAGTAAEWTASDPVLRLGEFGYSTDDNVLKVGDGTSLWSELVTAVTVLG